VASWTWAGFDDGGDRLHKTTAAGALAAEQVFPPDHGGTQRTLARVVGRLDSFHVQERPQPVGMLLQRLPNAGQLGVAAEHTAQQDAVDLLGDRYHQAPESTAGGGAVAAAGQVAEALLGGSHQLAAQPFHLLVCMIDQYREGWLQVRPAPL